MSKLCEYWVMTSVPSQMAYLIEPFEWGLACCLNLTFLTSPCLVIYGFSNCSFCWHWAVQNWVILLTLDKSRMTLLLCIHWLWAGKLFYWIWTLGCQKQPQPSPFDKKIWRIQEPLIGTGLSCVHCWFSSRNREPAGFPS